MSVELTFIGQISTPYQSIKECPNNIDPVDGPECSIEIDEAYLEGLNGLCKGDYILVMYWLGEANRKVEVYGEEQRKGSFALRTPHRPNPIGAAVVKIESIGEMNIAVRGLDCLNQTALIDIKPAIYFERPNQID
ncbi:SAM-dependent methyltransferase [Vibrio maerlii]|uniref:SAM-dependent methyltransferase n=1 Tax=Vibrio maerlii TaxID=2231648 RepID=UPI000E3D0A7A|nr:SAM-dependent methyltransferase [Vibrio maerlii]